jgi:pimeloyl-ACP methyl ester carboxylesterase
MTASTQQQTPRHAVSADGTPIAYWSSGSGPPMLLVHGGMSDHRRWRIPPYLEPDRTVHVMDRRGRGESGDGPDWSLDQEVHDVVAVVEQIAGDAGMPVDLLGHSLGGLLALRAAARTRQVRRLVLYEPAVSEPPQPPELLDRMGDLIDAGQSDEAVTLMMREVVHMPEHEIAALQSQPSWPARVATAPTLPRELGVWLVWNPQEEAAAVTVPTLVLVGGDSPEDIRGAALTVADALPASRVVVLEGQQHVADQFIPEQFAALVRDFLLEPEA